MAATDNKDKNSNTNTKLDEKIMLAIKEIRSKGKRPDELAILNFLKNELKDLTNIAFQNDVFGAPTFVVNNNLFWGQDRLEYALDELNN